jgi:D-glycerate 3-kinase
MWYYCVQVSDFVSRFMPAYQAYLPHLYRSGPTTAKANHTLVIEVLHTSHLSH